MMMNNYSDTPAISIVMAVHDNADDIERHLPLFLQQEYKGEVQVVIVDDSSTDGTSDVLKRFCHQHNNIYVELGAVPTIPDQPGGVDPEEPEEPESKKVR